MAYRIHKAVSSAYPLSDLTLLAYTAAVLVSAIEYLITHGADCAISRIYRPLT